MPRIPRAIPKRAHFNLWNGTRHVAGFHSPFGNLRGCSVPGKVREDVAVTGEQLHAEVAKPCLEFVDRCQGLVTIVIDYHSFMDLVEKAYGLLSDGLRCGRPAVSVHKSSVEKRVSGFLEAPLLDQRSGTDRPRP